MKIIRIILYIVSISGTALGVGLIKSTEASEAFADGTYAAKLANGNAIFFVALIILCANIYWGIIRWALRGYREKWRVGQIIGKLIGGGIWRCLVILPLFLISLFVLTPLVNGTIYNNILAEQENFTPFNPDYAEDRIAYLAERFDGLKPEEVLEELGELMLTNIEFDPDYVETATSRMVLPFENQVYARTKKVSTLTKAKLSDGQHFVIFYTDTGDDAITDAQAENLANMMEEIIAGYKNNLGFDYSYEKISMGAIAERGIKKVLRASNVDENILNTAMPVYVANPYSTDTGVLATYAGRRFADFGTNLLVALGGLFGEETAKFYSSAPSYPFVNILPVNVGTEDLKTVTAHELGHHYAANYNYNNYHKTGSDDNFIDETGPNWMAVNAVGSGPKEGVINGGHYNRTYLAYGTSTTISEAVSDFDGYPPLAFLENYYEIVPDGKTKIMNAIYYGDALNYLYNQAGAEYFQKVMAQLAERNLTGDYNGKLINYKLPRGEKLYCTDACTHNYSINQASTQYLYFTPDEYKNTAVDFSGNDKTVKASVLAKTLAGDWQVIKYADMEQTLDFDNEDYDTYEVVALAISNADIKTLNNYTIKITKTSLEELLEDEEYQSSFGEGFLVDLGGGCYKIDFNAFLSLIGQTIPELDSYDVILCMNSIKDGIGFDEAKRGLMNAVDYSFSIYNHDEKNMRLSAFVGVELLKRSAKGWVLIEEDGDLGLITIKVDAK